MALSFVVIPFRIRFFRSRPFAPAPAAASEAAPAGQAFPFRRPAAGSARPALKRAAAQPSECGGEGSDARRPRRNPDRHSAPLPRNESYDRAQIKNQQVVIYATTY